MIHRIPISQIHTYWSILEKAAMEALPPYVDDAEVRLFNILLALQNGDLQGFVLGAVNKETGKPVLAASFMTEVMVDGISKTKNLGLYSMFGYQNLPLECYLEIRDYLLKYAASCGCSKLCAYSSNDAVIRFCERFGGKIEYRFITFEVPRKEVVAHVEQTEDQAVSVAV